MVYTSSFDRINGKCEELFAIQMIRNVEPKMHISHYNVLSQLVVICVMAAAPAWSSCIPHETSIFDNLIKMVKMPSQILQ